jgi:SOS-response transcriptional repressor LexA
MTRLTYAQVRLASFIDDYWRTHMAPPSVRELMTLTGKRSTSTVSFLIKQLRKNGYLMEARKGEARAIVPKWVAEAIRQFEVTGATRAADGRDSP